MAPFAFDTLSASKRLREAGMAEGVAEAVVAVFQHATASVDLSQLATKADIADMATKADIADMVTKADIADMATKADLERFATKADLERFATKADLERFATKADLERFATKADLSPFATKVDLDEMRTETNAEFGAVRAEMRAAFSDFDARLSRRLLAYFLSLSGLMVSLAFGAAAFVRLSP